jgi:hypothetical protein
MPPAFRRAVVLVVALVAAHALAGARGRSAGPRRITGDWLWGVGPEPPRGPVQAVAHCGSHPALIHVIEHDGGVVDAEVQEARPMTGGAAPPPPRFTTVVREHLHGALEGTRLLLEGTHDVVHRAGPLPPAPFGDAPPAPPRLPPDVHEPVRVALRYVPRTGHFVGTRNGAAIWLARGSIVQAVGPCPP